MTRFATSLLVGAAEAEKLDKTLTLVAAATDDDTKKNTAAVLDLRLGS